MHIMILGTRGVPAKHGGFETFAHNLSLYLKARNHDVTVYCQVSSSEVAGEETWNGVRRILIPAGDNAFGTIMFDWAATWHSSFEKGIVLTLGYNTGVFNLLYRLRGIPNVMNMDGIEWKREKWSRLQRAWLWLNEWAGARAANHLIADHPEIGTHLLRHTAREKITVIPYGAYRVDSAPVETVQKYGLASKQYYLLIARPEPENSVLEIVRGYSQKHRGEPLVVLGAYDPQNNRYHKEVMNMAGPEVVFLGAIYEHATVEALRFHAKAYLHGHRVGGTNPSLVESLAAGNAVIAHDNRFNRWVAGESARYFSSAEDVAQIIDSVEASPDQLLEMEAGSRKQHQLLFQQDQILLRYEELLLKYAPVDAPAPHEDAPVK